MKSIKELIQDLEKSVNKPEITDIFSDKIVNEIKSVISSLKEKAFHLEEIESKLESMQALIIKPITERLKKGTKFSRNGYLVGLVGLIIGFLGVLLNFGFINFENTCDRTLIRISTANPNGVYYPIGVGLSTVLNRNEDLNLKAQVIVSEGSVKNLESIEDDECELAFIQSDIFKISTYQKKAEGGPRNKLTTKTKIIAKLYEEPWHIICKSTR